jgi:hypothetical protein
VLATNIAETSLTVPGIRYVVDAGTARISRYSARTRYSGCPSSRSRRPRPTSVRALRPGGAGHRHPAVQRGRLPDPPPFTEPRSYAPTWHR